MKSRRKESPANAGLSFQEEPSNVIITIDDYEITVERVMTDNGNAEAPEVGDGGEQERGGAFLLLVGEDLSTRYPGIGAGPPRRKSRNNAAMNSELNRARSREGA